MKGVQTIVVIAGLLFSLMASAEDKLAREVMNKVEPLPRDLEIQLALSASATTFAPAVLSFFPNL